ncbi:MAG TPA: carbohydrate kinase family protein [Pseudonocardiaceae bacterium]|jgi:sugar/nucleoside kinase (ribokinase family)|nr:carbohydrate kinase family protein [Pseudonocardiaceae bacterium]
MTVLVVGDAGIDVMAKYDDPIVTGGDRRAGIRTTLGGAGANTAAWLAYLGAPTVLVARVGDDPAGRQVGGELAAAGVRCAFTVDPDAGTCCVVVLVDEHGQRTMLADRGAGTRITATDLPVALLAEARHLHLSGYVLLDESSQQAGIAMLTAARAAGLSTSVDPQAATLLTDPAAFRAAITGVDLLLPNTAELAALTGSADQASAADLLSVVGAVALTRGAAGACWIDGDGIVTVPADPVDCVDSTGAGDAFDAATVIAWLAGHDPATVLRAGVAAGTDAVIRIGAQPSVSRRSPGVPGSPVRG